jgi:DNA-directed RNA polymerase
MDQELARTEGRYLKQQERLEKDFGWSATSGPMAITRNYVQELASKVPTYLEPKDKNEKELTEIIKVLPKETIALCCLMSALDCIGKNMKFSGTVSYIGKALEGECYANSLMLSNKQMAKRLDKLARTRHGNLRYRRQAVRSIAKRNNFTFNNWDSKQRAIAGAWGVNLILDALPDVFSLAVVNGRGEKQLGLTEDAFNLANEAIKQAIHQYPVYLPSGRTPIPWTDWNKGGPVDSRFQHRATVLRSLHNETAAHVRGAIANGTMQPALDALNSIQNVGWQINTAILEVMKRCHADCVDIASLPRSKDLDLPDRSKAWDDMTESERKAWRIRANAVKLRNRGLMAERVMLAEDLTVAEYLSTGGTFYTPCNMDWRGRVYSLCHFNYQREDRVRSLFLFSNGLPMTEEGLYWLKVHVANTGDFDKISKKSFADRIAWVDYHKHLLFQCASNPFEQTFWHDADKPFQFLAACMELVSAIQNPKHITHLPISLDGSCSGLQHLSAMTKAAEGALVNLVHSDAPQDIYSTVAERVTNNLKKLLTRNDLSQTERNLATMCLEYGVTRSLVKRNVMTYGYSSQKFGMGSQLMEDLMRPLALEVMSGEREFHPFGEDNGFTASRFLASHIFEAIEEVVKKPAEAMGFLRHLAKALAHENKAVTWLTPVGVPWLNRYHEPNVQRVNLWLNDKGVMVKHKVSTGNGWKKDIDKSKSANGIAPNFVHALDASHLMMTVNRLRQEGISDVALVHDSFGVHAPNAAILGECLREEFVRLYTDYDPLNDILESNRDRVTNQSRLPTPIKKGPLDIEEILNAQYAFS